MNLHLVAAYGKSQYEDQRAAGAFERGPLLN